MRQGFLEYLLYTYSRVNGVYFVLPVKMPFMDNYKNYIRCYICGKRQLPEEYANILIGDWGWGKQDNRYYCPDHYDATYVLYKLLAKAPIYIESVCNSQVTFILQNKKKEFLAELDSGEFVLITNKQKDDILNIWENGHQVKLEFSDLVSKDDIYIPDQLQIKVISTEL